MNARPRWKKILIGILIFLALCTAYRIILRSILNTKLNEIRSAGYPVTSEELNEWYSRVPPEENAAEVYLKAFEKYVDESGESLELLPIVGDAEMPGPTEQLSVEMKDAIT